MSELRQVTTEEMSFQDMRDEGKFYVDKSMLIADILDTDDRGVYLFTRPCRFGKSTNISMLDAFFNLECKGNRWFDGLEIADHPSYDPYRNAFPVIYVDLKDIVPTGEMDFGEFMKQFANSIRESFRDSVTSWIPDPSTTTRGNS